MKTIESTLDVMFGITHTAFYVCSQPARSAAAIKVGCDFTQSFGQEGMGPAFKNDPKDPKKLFYLDAFDYRRRRPKAELAGCCSITMYLRKELKAAGHPEGNFRDQLMLAVRGWRLIDRIRVKSLNR